MSTNLPKSRNRNLPTPPAEPAEVRRRPVMTPVQQVPAEPEPGRNILRPVLAMLIIGGLLLTGIHFYIRRADSDVRKSESAIGLLSDIGRGIWESRGLASSLSTESAEREKDLADLPRIFQAAAQRGFHSTRVIEGDPPPGRGNATHQIQFVLRDTVNIILHVYYDEKDGRILFTGVSNRLVPERTPGKPKPSIPPEALATPPAVPAGTIPTPPADAQSPAPAPAPPEKVSVPPAIPR